MPTRLPSPSTMLPNCLLPTTPAMPSSTTTHSSERTPVSLVVHLVVSVVLRLCHLSRVVLI